MVASLRAFMLVIVPRTTARVVALRGLCLNVIVTLYCCWSRLITGEVWSIWKCASPVRGISNINVMGSNSYKTDSNW